MAEPNNPNNKREEEGCLHRLAQSTKSVVILTLVIYAFFRYFILNAHSDHEFSISRDKLKFHSNWTTSIDRVRHLSELRNALTFDNIQELDLSFAMSTSLDLDDISQIIPGMFKQYKKINLNFGNVPLGNKGADYIVSSIPNGV